MRKIAFIPARSGSKGLANKNIKDMNGKPLIAYTIEAAIRSGVFERVFVSTDSSEYGIIAESFGAEVLFRDASLSDDNATTFMVIKDLLGKLERSFDYFALLQPTSPLRNQEHIREAVKLFEDNFELFDFLVSVKQAEFNSELVQPIEEDLSLKYFLMDFSNYSRQKYKSFSPNGAIYLAKPKQYLTQGHFYGSRSIAYIMDKKSSVDIDDDFDFQIASYVMRDDEFD